MTGGGAPGRDETETERLDRNLEELYAGLRVALPGVQVLFAFLLVLPFQQQFDTISAFDEKVYFGTLLATTAASLCLIATSVRHRLRFRRGDKEWVVLSGNRLAITGLGFLGLAISGAILLVSDVLFGVATAAVATASVAGLLIWLWFASPLLRDLR